MSTDPLSYDNVEEADFLLTATDGEPWKLPLTWEDCTGAPIDISEAGWAVSAKLRLANGLRSVQCEMTSAETGGFEVALTPEDVAVLPIPRPASLIVTIEDPADQRFHFVFPINRRVL